MRISASSSDVCSSDLYKTGKDLDGQPFTFHARGTGTEAIGNIIAKREGIKFGQRSYVPGSENRIIAMMKGQINATVVDLANKNKLMEMGEGKFRVLRSEEHTSELQSLMRISYAVFCLKKKNNHTQKNNTQQ